MRTAIFTKDTHLGARFAMVQESRVGQISATTKKEFTTRDETRSVFENAVSTSKQNGWRLIYDGLPNFG